MTVAIVNFLHRHRVVAAVLLLLTGSVSVAQSGTSSQPMLFSRISIDQGLSQSNVLSMLQDRDGMMWLATEDGLNRYDGYRFTHFKRDRGNPDALVSDFVFDIEQGEGDVLWLATDGGGLSKLDRNSGLVKTYRASDALGTLTSDRLRDVLIDKNGLVWVATRQSGLGYFDPESEAFTPVALSDATETPRLHSLYFDARGLLWVGGDHGLTAIDTKTNQQVAFKHDPDNAQSLQAGSVRSILQDSQGNLWVGTYGGGLSRMVPGSQRFERFTHDAADQSTISHDRVTTIFEDSAGRLWVGTINGLNRIRHSDGTATRYFNVGSDVASLSDNNITSIYEDRSGLLWIGTKTKGVNTWNPHTWGLGFEPAEQLTATEAVRPVVTSFTTDAQGKLWVGTFGDGLAQMDRVAGALKQYRTESPDGLSIGDDRVMALLTDSAGKIWIGTMTRGVTVLDPQTGDMTQYQHDPADDRSLSANGIMSLFEDRAGNVWVGTYGGGAVRFDRDSESFIRLPTATMVTEGLSNNKVTSFAQDPSGMLWIGTEGGGLNLYDQELSRFFNFRHDSNTIGTLADDTVYSINVDVGGNVWVGTRGGGLDKVVGAVSEPEAITFSNTSQSDGLGNDVIYGIQFDSKGWMWLSTNYGISKFKPATGAIEVLHRKDGLQSEEFNFGAHYKSESGEMFFGCHNGFNAFHPEQVTKNAIAPLIALTGFFRGNDPVRADVPLDDEGRVVVDWNSNDVSFEFSALDFASPAENQYQYRLEGLDDAWVSLGSQRRITYTDLAKGDYTLHVRASNHDGVWNETGIRIPVIVNPAPWNTTAAHVFYVAASALLIFVLWMGHRNRLAREEAYSRRLESEVSARTEMLSESNRQLQTLNTKLQESSLSDPLTGLRNRRFVFEEVARDLEGVQRRFNTNLQNGKPSEHSELVFMMIDMDNFKPINDTYGHAAGDTMLLEFRDVLQSICRRNDYLIRWGGDEFVVIARQDSPEESSALAERIRATVDARHFSLGDGQVARTTCSIGFVAYPLFRANAEETNLDHIIGIADSLMYEAKRQRNAWVGMLRADEAITSENFDHDAIESTSLLFRARRAQNLSRHDGATLTGTRKGIASLKAVK
ncbi:MAG: two-component regulator propeller domain-containing protein [Pseudomonadota bacterium]